MAISWTIARSSVVDERTFEAWGILSATAKFINQDLDTLDLGFGRSDLLANLPFDPDETLVVKADGAVFFRGRIVSEKRGAYGSTEGMVLSLAGPWWYLQKIIYEQSIQAVVDHNANPAPASPNGLQASDFVTATVLASNIILSQDVQSTRLDTKTMILAVLNYAISKGAPIAIGTIDAGIDAPRDQISDATCAELIQKSLRWTPEQTAWWDYSVNPPALNIRARANRPLVPIDLHVTAVDQAEINPRRDLLITGVTINYLRRHQRTAYEFITLDKDVAGPNPSGIGALIVTIELYGSWLNGATVIAEEAAPVGLAASLYNTYSALAFEGRVRLVADDVDLTSYLSKTLRVFNGAPAWATAIMDVQQVALDLFSGRTEISVGPPKQLGANDIVGLVRKGRTIAPPITTILNNGGSPQNTLLPGSSSDPRLRLGPLGNSIVTIIGHFTNQDSETGFIYDFKQDSADIYDNRVNNSHQGFVDWDTWATSGQVVLAYGVLFGTYADHAVVDTAANDPLRAHPHPAPAGKHYVLFQEDFDAHGYKKPGH